MLQLLIQIGKAIVWMPRATGELFDSTLEPDMRGKIFICVGMTILGLILISLFTWWIFQGEQGWKSLAVMVDVLFYFFAYLMTRMVFKEHGFQF